MGYRPWDKPSVGEEWKIFLHMPLAEVRRLMEGYAVIARIYRSVGDTMVATEKVAVVREDHAQIEHERDERVMLRLDDTRRYGWEEFRLSDPSALEQFHQAVLSLSNDGATYALWIHEERRRVIVVETPVEVEPKPAEMPATSAEQVPCSQVSCTQIVHPPECLTGPTRTDNTLGMPLQYQICTGCGMPVYESRG
jgi:hypothetical protein